MKYKSAQYAEALALALDGADHETARARTRSFVALLKNHQMLGKADAIVKKAVRRLASRAGVTRVKIESADPLDSEVEKQVSDLFGGKVWIEEKVDPELLAGVRILIDEETLIDASGKRRLAEMFYKKSRAGA